MRIALAVAIALPCFAPVAGSARPAAEPALSSDTDPAAPAPFFRFGPNGAPPGSPGRKGEMPGVVPPVFGPNGALPAPPAVRPDSAEATAPEPSRPVPTHAEMLDRLLDRLAKATDPDEAKGVAALIQRLWMRSGSDTADLLMERAVAAMDASRSDVAEALLDKIIDLEPEWAEAWNRRATLRFIAHDDRGSMEDISHVLALEPRHFGALSGMGFILERNGEDKAALKVMRRALALDPQDPELRKAVDKLTPEVDGQDL